MPLTRLSQWDTVLLPAFLAQRRAQAFAWGGNDCSLFAADAVQAITGVDIAADFRGKYHDEATAFALIHSVTGGSTVADAAAHCASRHGLLEIAHPLCAQRGDLVVVTNANRVIAGVVHSDGRHVASVGEEGMLYLPIRQIQQAWKV